MIRGRRGRPHPGRLAALVLCGLPLLAAGHAQPPSLAAAPELPLWELGLGAALVSLPHYRGSDQSRTWVLPLPWAIYRGQILRADRDGARAVLVDSERIDVDLSVAAAAPADSSDNRARRGMADLPPVLEIGPKVNLSLARGSGWRADLRLPVRAAIALRGGVRSVGWLATPQFTVDGRVAGWDAGIITGPIWGSRQFNALTYDVTAKDATAQRPAYRSEGGYAGWQFTAGVSRRIGDLWIGTYLRHDSVRGAVFEASPLVRRSSNLSGGVALAWVFGQSGQRVPDPNLR